MTGRLVHLVAATGAVLLAAAAYRIANAESAYQAGLEQADDPQSSAAADVPGRLEEYEEAMRRDPGEPLFALRAGQIRLHRAARSVGEARARDLATARDLLHAAARLRPVDSTIHATIAQLERVAGDAAAAMRSAHVALRLAPRAPSVLGTAVSVGLWAWADTGDPQSLRLALLGGVGFAAIGRNDTIGWFRAPFAEAGPDLAADLLEATTHEPALRKFAADAVRPVRPLVAGSLDEFGSAGEPNR